MPRLLAHLALALLAGLLTHAAAAQTGPKKPAPPPGRDPGGIAVAVIGAGIDFRDPEIARRLARDGEGELIAWDIVDDDARPLEAQPTPGRRLPAHAGTAASRLLLAEAPATRLVPVRVPDGNPLAAGGALAFVRQTPARIAVLLADLGAEPPPALLTDVLRQSRHLLVILPARNNAAAALKLDTVLSVAATPNGSDAPDPASSAEITIPPATDAASSATPPDPTAAPNRAALRLAALAARLLASEPRLDAKTLKARLLSLAEPPAATGKPAVIDNARMRAPH